MTYLFIEKRLLVIKRCPIHKGNVMRQNRKNGSREPGLFNHEYDLTEP